MSEARSQRPILVTGSHRSGTTWVGRMLAADSSIAYIHEPFNPHHRPGICAAEFSHWFEHIPRHRPTVYAEALRRCVSLQYDVAAELRAIRSPRDAVRLVRDSFVTSRNRRARKRPLVKDPIAILSAEWLEDAFGMDVVVMIRHPAAFAGSLKKANWRTPLEDLLAQPDLMDGDLREFREELETATHGETDIVDHAITWWRVLHHVITRYQERHPHWIFLRHEDVSRDPLRFFRDLYGQLGLRYDQAAQTRIERSSSPTNPAEARHTRDLLRDSRGNVTNWKRRLDADEVTRIRSATEDLWPQFYEPADW